MHLCLLYKLMRSQFGFGISDRGSGDIKEVPLTTKKGVRKKPKLGHTQFNKAFFGGIEILIVECAVPTSVYF